MKKAVCAVIPAAALLFASCNFWNEPVKDFFEYWTSEAYISGWDARAAKQNDSSGVTSIASGADAEVLLKAENPKGFHFIMPTPGSSEMIDFTGLSAQPVPGTDYTLTQVSADTLKLTYKSSFLQAHEWGNGDFGAVITLHADDGRKFKRPYSFNLKANTPPPAPTFILAKTAATPEEYVLCLKVAASEMARMVNGEMLHKDIAKIDIGGSVYDLTVNAARTDFVKPPAPAGANAHFIDFAAVRQLTTPPQPAVPADTWVLYYKTDVSVGSGAYREYPVRLMDEKGLVSETLTAGTATTEPPPENVTVTTGEQGTGSGTYTAPFIIKGAASAPEALLQIGNVAGTTVHCTVTEVVAATTAQYEGNPVTFPLTLNGQTAKLYKVEYYTDGTGFKPSQVKTKYYKVAKSYTITFSVNGQGGSLTGTYNGNAQRATSGGGTKTVRAAAGETISFSAAAESADYAVHSWTGVTASPPSGTTAALTVTGDATVTVKFYETTLDVNSHTTEAWKKLKERIAAAPSGGTLKISGTIPIQSTTAPGNSGEIIIDKDLTIEAKTGTATLDANESAFSTGEGKHRIFRVKDGKQLTLKNLTLINGYAGKSTVDNLGTTGGGIRLESGTVSLSGVTISGCKAITTTALGGGGSWHGDGGGIYVVSGNIIMENTTLSANDASAHGGAVYLNGGTLTMKGSSVITPSTISNANKTGKNDVHLKGGAKIIVDDALTGTAPVARIKVAYNEYLPTRQVLDGTAVGANNTKFIVTDQDLGTDNGGVHVRKWKIKSNGYLESEEVTLDGSEIRAWQALKDAVRTASDGDVIAINGTIQATNLGTGEYVDNGEIVIDKNLTIKKADTAATAVLDANKDAGSKPKHRIFKVEAGKTLTLQNLTLKGGIAEMSDMDGGGGVYVETSGKLIMTGSSITDCEAIGDTVHNNYGEGGGVCNKGTVEMTGGEIKNNKARNGGGIFVNDGCILTLDKYTGGGTPQGVRIIGNEAGRGGGVRANNSTVTMTGCIILGNKSTDTLTNLSNAGGGGGVDIHGNTSGRPITMTDCTIQGNTAATNGGGVNIESATVNITNCTLTGNSATDGGGIYAIKLTSSTSASTVTISGCTIGGTTAADANKATGSDGQGGAIYVGTGCILTMQDNAQLTGNTATKSGGGVYSRGVFKMTGGEIKSNTAQYGGGIYVKDSVATLTMSGGTISANNAVADSNDSGRGGDGGGVYIDGAKFTLTAGTISNNTADKDGGGVRVFGGVFTMEGGVIQGNTVTGTSTVQNSGHGGGVEIVAAVMNMKGGEIKNNTAKNGGGGVSLGLSGASNSVLNMSGGTISGNTLTETSGKGAGVEFFTESTTHSGTTYYTRMKMSGSAKVDTNNDVYVNNSRMITVDGALTGTAPAARITPKTYAAGLQVLEAGTGVNLASEAGKFTVTPKSGTPPEYWGINNTGNLTQDKTSIFNAVSNDQIKAAESSMTATQIADRKANLLGKLVLYKTSEGNYGIMRVTAVDNTEAGYIRIDYKTFNSDGSIKKSENNRKVNGTYSFDLDKGIDSGGDFDFWLENLNSTDAGRLFKPANGAKFYVLP